MCCKDVTGTQLSTQKFIEKVNAVIKQYNGKLVEELELKYLQLSSFVKSDDQVNIVSLASFLSDAPFIEELEIHFAVCASPHCSEVIRRLRRCTHNHLNGLCITGFAGCTG
ncbi:hypothetical protein C2845_PM14G13100 [Panicum miliaceum]|uniref:FBD domain-containing protein n=1 Tax=Panicum miliaceum TaxID=4540 RepID=A0A3L6PNC9_PANMI|nr:hypothetical protein C2845_PM14G13100 [Panicum miliaceum]